ncbi:MAG: hypothetical protein IJF74_07190 [Clostridia bacterium]|nr:hypothetical protein [Clostridia bacterium]
MKKLAIISLILAVIMLMAGCAPAVPIAEGAYIARSFHKDEHMCPFFHINIKDMRFVHSASPMMSYAMFGDIKIKGDKLIATPDHHDKSGVIVFTIDGNDLIYDADESTVPPLAITDDTSIRDSLKITNSVVPDGTIFFFTE